MSAFKIEEEITPKSWDDITHRPCYESPVEPKKFRLVRITAVFYRVLSSFRKTYPADLLTALKELATNKDDNTILAALSENEADPSQREYVEQLQGLGIFAADIRNELIGKILKPLIELEELAADLDADPSLTRYCQWADNLEEQFAYSEYLVKEGRAFFDIKNLERLKSIPLPKASAHLILSLHWNCDKATSRRRQDRMRIFSGGS